MIRTIVRLAVLVIIVLGTGIVLLKILGIWP